MAKKPKTAKNSAKQAHRGRFQAQGQKLESSVAWAVPIPPSTEEGNKMLQDLESKLQAEEAKLRQTAFNDARNYIQAAYVAGGAYAPINKTFPVRSTRKERVDLEVNGGLAFKVEKQA
ncbi:MULTISPECIES: hypothetical protein [Enterobacter]|uniref:Uncharacterized protein n=1 Tax=Enterobacter soli TaxID=885040 RepID=A0AAW8HFH3_9ENTR|nr:MULTISPECIES: hypothetical protein [Enterobacter]EFE5937910.1 hypothetical protein [Escherichia coli]EIZ2433582.1 hypothetical protein [Cronobacter sakazakii]EIZ2458196.1 hypothetical protein [Cronobacter sakazakii]EIZ9682089.1 hypothetical protein [Cronobacter sakazakii]EIZ9687720.1 hypothetical protein [Cronobacter sakazakii]